MVQLNGMYMATIQVVAAIFTSHAGVLAFRRRPELSAGGKWEFPGGKVDPGESPEQALIREVAEELACDIDVGALLDRTTTQVGDHSIDLACYFVRVKNDYPLVSTDHDEIRWLTSKALLDLDWATPDLPAVRLLSSGL